MPRILLAAAGLALTLVSAAQAGEPVIALTLKDHRFAPADFPVPAGVKVRIVLTNQDGASEEFDSDDLKVERDVSPHGRVSFDIGPLKPGIYDFQGELHPLTAQGRMVAGGGS